MNLNITFCNSRIILLCLAILLPWNISVSAKDINPELFRKQMLAAIDSTNNALLHVRIQGETQRTLLSGTIAPLKTATPSNNSYGRKRIYARNGTFELLDYSDNAGADFRRVILKDGKDGYVLRHNSDHRLYIELNELSEYYRDFLESKKVELFGAIYSFLLIDLSTALNEVDFVIEKVVEQQDGLKTLDNVTFRRREFRKLKSGPQTFETSGTFVVDPANSFAVCSYKARRERTTANQPSYLSEGDGEVEYIPNTNYPQIRRSVANLHTSSGQNTRDSFVANSWSYEVVPEQQFMLRY